MSRPLRVALLALLALVPLGLAGALSAPGAESAPDDPAAGLVALVGAVHEHSGFSDGEPGTEPADYYAAGRREGLDFLAGTEHAESLSVPGTVSESCYRSFEDLAACVGTGQGEDAVRKWDAAGEQAAAATDPSFTALRGFEWTSDRHNHVNVLGSRSFTSAYADGGNVSLDTFWSWFTRSPSQGGGATAWGSSTTRGPSG